MTVSVTVSSRDVTVPYPAITVHDRVRDRAIPGHYRAFPGRDRAVPGNNRARPCP